MKRKKDLIKQIEIILYSYDVVKIKAIYNVLCKLKRG